MVDGRQWQLLPRPAREFPADLAGIVVLVVLADLSVLLSTVSETPLRIVFGLAFVLFAPGYAFTAALFPERATGTDTDGASNARRDTLLYKRGVDGIERTVLSFGLSIAIVPLIGLGLSATSWGIRLVPIVLSLSGFTLVAVGVAAVRRWNLPVEKRFRLPYEPWVERARSTLFPETRTDAALNVLLVASLVLAVGTVGYAVAIPGSGEAFTEFYLLTENETGAFIADDYPTEFERGQSKPVLVGIDNHEHEPVDYVVVVELQRVRGANDSTTVIEERELQRFTPRVGHNEAWTTTYDVTPTLTGERLRLAFLLYRDDAPSNPTVENSYRELHLWINVSSPDT